MRIFLKFYLLYFLIFAMYAKGQENLPVHEDLITGQLDNGFKYFILKNEMPKNMVSFRLATHVGSILEDEHERGLAHFVEHMAFNGSANFEKNELINFLEKTGTRFGADLNAYTSFDETVYMVDIKSDDPDLLDKAILVFEDWAGRLSFDPEEIDKERGVIMAEYKGRLGPFERMGNEIYPIQFYGSNYANRLPIGIPEVIENADYETIRSFYEQWYRPDLMALIVIGDIDVADMEKQIQDRFAFLKSPDVVKDRVRESLPLETGKLVKVASDKEANMTIVEMSYRHRKKTIATVEGYKEAVLRRLFANMFGSRLEDYTKKSDPPFMFAFANYYPSVGDIDAYSSVCYTSPDKISESVAVLAMENRRVLLHGFLESELERAKSSVKTSLEKLVLEKDQRESQYYVNSLVSHYLKASPFLSADQTMKYTMLYLDDISLSDFNESLSNWIRPDDLILTVMTPEVPNIELPDESELLNLVDEIGQIDPGAYTDEDIPEFLMEALTPDGLEYTMKKTEFNDMVAWQLPNGIEVFYMPTNFKNDELYMYAMKPGGKSILSDEDLLHTLLSTDIVTNSGVGEWDAKVISKFELDKVMNIYPIISNYHNVMIGISSPRNLRAFFEKLYLLSSAPRMTEEGFKSALSENKSWRQNDMENPDYYFRYLVNEIYTKGNLRERIYQADDLDAVDPVRSYDIFKTFFGCSEGYKFVFVGASDEEELMQYIISHLSRIPTCGSENKIQYHPVDVETEVLKHTINKGIEEKSMSTMKLKGDMEYEERTNKIFRIAISIAQIKLRERIREDLGGVYGIYLSGYLDRYGDVFEWSMGYTSDPGKTEMLMDEAIKVLDTLRQFGPQEEDILKVKEQQLQAFRTDSQTNRFWASQLVNKIINGEDYTKLSLDHLKAFWDTVTQDEIKDMMATIFKYEEAFIAYLYPEESEDIDP